MKRTTKQHEEWLRQRFLVARRIVAGEFGGYALSESVLKSTLNVSLKTHQGDIKRAKIYATFDEWRPAKPIEFPNYKRVARAKVRLSLFQAGAITPSPTNLIRKDTLATVSLQRIDLKVKPLLSCRYSCVANEHAAIVAELITPFKHSNLISLHSFRP